MNDRAADTIAGEFGPTKPASVNGTTLAYREEGQGEPVVFVHGAFSDLRNWEPQLSALGRTHRAIAYSCRFCRPNERVEPGVGDLRHMYVEDLAALLRELDATPAHLVGNSSGALFALALAQRYPDLVRSVVAEEPPVLELFVSIPPRPMQLLRVLATRPRTALGITRFGLTMARMQKHFLRGEDAAAARIFMRGVLGDAAFKRISQERWAQALENLDELRAIAHGATLFPPIDDDGMRGIRAPVLLLTGDHSPAFFLRLTDRLEELLPNVDRREIPNASHLMHEDNPPAVNQVILEFIGRHRDRNTGLHPTCRSLPFSAASAASDHTRPRSGGPAGAARERGSAVVNGRSLNHEEARRFYDRFGAWQDSQAFYEQPALDRMLPHLALGQARAVVEFGCGTGKFAAELLARHLGPECRYLGLDLSRTMIELARSRIAPFGDRAEIRQTDGAPRVDVADSSFDRFVCTYVLDLLPLDEIRMLLEEAHRVLVPRGRLGVASLTHGRSGLPRAVTWAWQRLHRFGPALVGGCRPIEVANLLSDARWRLHHRSVVSPYAISSEVIVAERA